MTDGFIFGADQAVMDILRQQKKVEEDRLKKADEAEKKIEELEEKIKRLEEDNPPRRSV